MGAFDTGAGHPLRERVRSSFTASYLTLLGVAQGVALAELAAVVDGDHRRFTIIHWLMTAVTFLLLIVVWDHLSTDAMTFVWIPDFRDSALPLLIGAVELFLCHAVAIGLAVWLEGICATAIIATLYIWYVRWQSERDAENSAAIRYIRERWRVHRWCNIAGVMGFPVLAAASASGALGTAEQIRGPRSLLAICAILLVAVWLLGYVIGTYRAWARTVEALERQTERRRPWSIVRRRHSVASLQGAEGDD